MLLDDIFLIIYNLIIIIYDLNEKDINDEKLLKNSSSIALKSFIKKSIKELINNLIIEPNIMLTMKDLYKKNDILQRIIYAKEIEQIKIPQNLIKENLRLKLENY